MDKKKIIRANGMYRREIKDVIFNGPATVIKWGDNGSSFAEPKSVVKCQKGDVYDPTTGFLLAVIKGFVDKESYGNILRMIDDFGTSFFWIGDHVRLKHGKVEYIIEDRKYDSEKKTWKYLCVPISKSHAKVWYEESKLVLFKS